jgi:hypothetical protein
MCTRTIFQLALKFVLAMVDVSGRLILERFLNRRALWVLLFLNFFGHCGGEEARVEATLSEPTLNMVRIKGITATSFIHLVGPEREIRKAAR